MKLLTLLSVFILFSCVQEIDPVDGESIEATPESTSVSSPEPKPPLMTPPLPTPSPAPVPKILNQVVSSITETTAKITISSDISVTARIEYGESSNLGLSKQILTLGTNQQITLNSLKANTKYFYKVTVTSDKSVSSSSSTLNFFTKAKIQIFPALKLVDIYEENLTQTSVKVWWELSDFATGQVEYWKKSLGRSKSIFLLPSQNDFKFKKHGFSLTGLSAGVSYQYVVHSRDKNGTKVDEHIPREFTTLKAVVPTPAPTPVPAPIPADNKLKAFPAAFGGGSQASGWRNGGVLVRVNTLNPTASLVYDADSKSYTGGFLSALNLNKPKIIVFEVSGNIKMPKSGTQGVFGYNGIRNASNTLVLGQTAPLGGITITGGTFKFYAAKDLVLRYIRSRPIYDQYGKKTSEDDANTSAFLINGGNRVMIDHCSASFAQDKGINVYHNGNIPTQNITISNTLIADSNTMANMGNNPQADPTIIGNLSFIYNLLGNSRHRTPNMHSDNYGEIINNVIHGWGSRLTNTYHDLELNHIANYYKNPGLSRAANKYQEVRKLKPTIFTSKNYYDGLLTGKDGENNRILWENFSSTAKLPDSFFTNEMHTRLVDNPSPILSAQEAYDKVTRDVGANRYIDNNGQVKNYIDSYDESVISNVLKNIRVTPKNIANWNLPTLPQNKRPSNYDSDHDGMADQWEIRTFGDLSQSYDGDEDKDGYLNIEEFANQVDY